jgi:hypothetical protein
LSYILAQAFVIVNIMLELVAFARIVNVRRWRRQV